MYCENCGALRQAGNAFCVSCGSSLGAADRPQGGPQSSFGYGDVTAVATQDNPLAVRLATIACWLAFASCAFWIPWAVNAPVFLRTRGSLRNASLYGWYCIPLLVAAGMLVARRRTPLIGAGFLVGTSLMIYITFFRLGLNKFERSYTGNVTGPMSLNLIAAALAVGALGCVSAAVIQAKPKIRIPSTKLTIFAFLAAAFSALNLVVFAYGYYLWPTYSPYYGEGLWLQVLTVVFALAIVASLALGCMLGGRAAASVAIAGATYFGLYTIQVLFYDNSDLAAGFFFGVLACGAFIATAVIASSIAKREMQPALLDPSLLAR